MSPSIGGSSIIVSPCSESEMRHNFQTIKKFMDDPITAFPQHPNDRRGDFAPSPLGQIILVPPDDKQPVMFDYPLRLIRCTGDLIRQHKYSDSFKTASGRHVIWATSSFEFLRKYWDTDGYSYLDIDGTHSGLTTPKTYIWNPLSFHGTGRDYEETSEDSEQFAFRDPYGDWYVLPFCGFTGVSFNEGMGETNAREIDCDIITAHSSGTLNYGRDKTVSDRTVSSKSLFPYAEEDYGGIALVQGNQHVLVATNSRRPTCVAGFTYTTITGSGVNPAPLSGNGLTSGRVILDADNNKITTVISGLYRITLHVQVSMTHSQTTVQLFELIGSIYTDSDKQSPGLRMSTPFLGSYNCSGELTMYRNVVADRDITAEILVSRTIHVSDPTVSGELSVEWISESADIVGLGT